MILTVREWLNNGVTVYNTDGTLCHNFNAYVLGYKIKNERAIIRLA